MSAERVDKFHEDAEKLIASKNSVKIASEVNKLRTWLQKHQYDVLPDGSKGKLLQILVLYQRFYQSLPDADAKDKFEPSLSGLFSDYLQLPEGKLLAAKDKKKVMTWLQSLSTGESSSIPSATSLTRCLVQDVDDSGKTVTIQAVNDESQWLEQIPVSSQEVYDNISSVFHAGEEDIVVLYDEANNVVVSLERK